MEVGPKCVYYMVVGCAAGANGSGFVYIASGYGNPCVSICYVLFELYFVIVKTLFPFTIKVSMWQYYLDNQPSWSVMKRMY